MMELLEIYDFKDILRMSKKIPTNHAMYRNTIKYYHINGHIEMSLYLLSMEIYFNYGKEVFKCEYHIA